MEHQPTDNPAPESAELQSLEAGLKKLWERVRQSGEAIVDLRQERSSMRGRIQELESQVRTLEQEIAKREVHIKDLAARHVEAQSREGFIVGNGEREAFMTRLKDLLARIDAYL